MTAWCARRRASRLKKLVSEAAEDATLEHLRPYLQNISGTILEIGAGPGNIIKFLPQSISYTALEPNQFFHDDIKTACATRGILQCAVAAGKGEELPFPNEAFSAVLEVRTLCSVRDVKKVLEEVRRVLKPGGLFIFADHVVAPPGSMRRLIQKLSVPVAKLFAGCNPARDIGHFIETAGFKELKIESFNHTASRYITAPRIYGFARK